MLGKEGLSDVAENAVLNANYIRVKLRPYYDIAFDVICKHECVFRPTKKMLENGVHTVDIAKAIIDRGFHPPTIYFPIVVNEAIMIEPTETESKETLDAFIEAMIEIAKLAEKDPQKVKDTPKTTPVSRPDEVAAAKQLNIACL
jgi:glycine dehydrogenase subunit 2